MDLDYKISQIEGFEGYFVDTKGNIFSQLRRGSTKKKHPFIKLKPSKLNKYGHMGVRIKRSDGKYLHRPIHFFVMEAFLGKRPCGKIACHGPRGKTDNSVKNLFWGTYKKNAEDRIRDNTTNSKLTKEDVVLIRGLLDQKIKQKQISEIFGVSGTAISQIKTFKTFNLKDLTAKTI